MHEQCLEEVEGDTYHGWQKKKGQWVEVPLMYRRKDDYFYFTLWACPLNSEVAITVANKGDLPLERN